MPHAPFFLLPGVGLTGGFLAEIICRDPRVRTLVIADPDTVTSDNVHAQIYQPRDSGKSKAEVTASRLATLRPDLTIIPVAAGLEELPLSAFGGVTLLCVDNNLARQIAAERAWLARGVLFDIAVNGTAGLARVTRVIPGIDHACLECAWSDLTYAQMPMRDGCRKTAPTNAPAALGAFAAGMAAIQFRSWTESPSLNQSEAIELVASPAGGEMWTSRVPRNPACRFGHGSATIELVEHADLGMSVDRLFAWLDADSLSVPGFNFVTRARCRAACSAEEDVLWLRRGSRQRPCPRCGDLLQSVPFAESSSLQRHQVPRALAGRCLEAVGLVPGDVVRSDSGRWFQLGLPFPQTRSAAA